MDEILPHVAAILSPKGCFYLVALKENGVDELLSTETRFIMNEYKYFVIFFLKEEIQSECRNNFDSQMQK